VWLGYIDLRACIMDLELADCTCAWLAPLSSRFTERPYDSPPLPSLGWSKCNGGAKLRSRN
jgi:hypothetical protein